uniref:Uncharacterized protein n=1 Tax=Cucumis sativus TaxID=3659 RepID=A0A0A0LRX9_CUCSA
MGVLDQCTISAPESTIHLATPTSHQHLTKAATQPISLQTRKKKAGIATPKDGSSHHKFSDSPNHSPSPVKTADHLLQNQLHHLSIHEVNDVVANNVHQSRSIHKSVSSDTIIEQHNSESNSPTMLLKIYELIASHRKGNTSIKSYFRNLKALWNEAAASSINLNSPQSSSNNAIEERSEFMEREKLMQFLLGLNDSYSLLCSQILAVRPSPTVDQAYSLIVGEQKTRKSKMTKKNTM